MTMLFKTICDCIISETQKQLESQEFLEQHKVPNHFVRKRKVSMYQIIMYLIYSSRASMSINLGNIRDALPDIKFPQISRQAISKARKGINPSLFHYLFDLTVRIYYSYAKQRKTWHGYHIFAIDGSQIHVSGSEENSRIFGIQGDSRYQRKHYMGLGSILYDVTEDIIVDAVLGSCNDSERHFALRHLKKMEQYHLKDRAIIIFDRGYYGTKFFTHMAERGVGCLMRIKQNTVSLTKGVKEDEIIKIKQIPFPVRVIKVTLNTGTIEYLVTNIFDSSLTADDFKELYHERWKIESKYWEIKTQFRLEEFNGACACCVYQEFFLTLYKSNFCSVIKNAADEAIEQNRNPNSNRRYQANRSHIIGRILYLLPRYLCRIAVQTSIVDLYEEGIKIKSLIREGRSAPRRKKYTHPLHCKNRKTTS